MQDVQVHLQQFRRNSFLKSVLQPEIAKKCTKNPYFESSRSFKVIDVDTNKSLSPLLVMISNMSVPIWNCFHTTRDNFGKITTF